MTTPRARCCDIIVLDCSLSMAKTIMYQNQRQKKFDIAKVRETENGGREKSEKRKTKKQKTQNEE